MGISQPAIGVPIGASLPYHGGVVPPNFLLMYGQTLNQSDYPALCAALGQPGPTFTLPDTRGRSLIGKDDMGGAAANRVTAGGSGVSGASLGAVGGGETVTNTTANIPAHNHTVSPSYAGGNTGSGGGMGQGSVAVLSVTTANNGSGGAHNNMPPVLVANLMIRAL